MKRLNTTELQIMKYLWKHDRGFMKDIVAQFPSSGPAYTTVATLVARMTDKGYIGFEKHGRDKEYYPKISRNSYFSGQVKDMVSHFFNDSTSQFASFFTRNSDLSIEEMEELQELLQRRIEEKSNG